MGQAFRKLFDTFFGNQEMRVISSSLVLFIWMGSRVILSSLICFGFSHSFYRPCLTFDVSEFWIWKRLYNSSLCFLDSSLLRIIDLLLAVA